MANDLTYTQISTVLNEIFAQATGVKQLAPANTSEFTNVATTLLQLGYDPLMQAISQVMGRTIFSIRPYRRKFRGLSVSRQQFAGWTRKLQVSDQDFTNEKSYELEDGKSVDMYKVIKPNVLQTNFYGQVVFKKHITTFLHQLDLAFRNPDELGMFWTMINQNSSDMIEQCHEVLARAVICNLIAGKTVCDPDSCFHLLTEYNTLTGQTLTKNELYLPEHYPEFIKWAYSRIAAIASLLTERSQKFQVQVKDHTIMRHTPVDRQRVFVYAPEQYSIDARVRTDIFNNGWLRMSYNEAVNFWQSIDTPDSIDVSPVYLQTDGTLNTAKDIQLTQVFGVIFDAEAAGYTVVNQWNSTTPLNSDGGYWNTFFHFTDRYLNDFTEKCVVLLLD